MANPAILVSLQTLRDLLIEEGRFLYGVSDDVKKVERELKTIHSFLMEADRWPDRHRTTIVADWIAELGELASRAEYVLEKYSIKVTPRRGGNLIKKVKRFSCMLSECLTVHQIGEEVKAIRSDLASLTGRLGTMASTGGASSNDPQQELRQTYGDKDEKHFVGMEDDIAFLVSLVMDQTRNRVISICGMGGLGKTTLAGKIYRHDDVKPCFEARAWVTGKQQFQLDTLLIEILEQLLPSGEKGRISSMGQRQLVKALRDVQMQKRCLIVIDDIWETDHWSILEHAFPIENNQCKVLLTTRNEKVGPQECLYKLDLLSEDQGWELLQKIALPRESQAEQCPSGVSHNNLEVQTIQNPAEVSHSRELEAIGREMIRKCGRLPLAISVLGGSLRQLKKTYAEWERVNKQIDTYLKFPDGGSVENKQSKQVQQVLDLSYNALPYYLKPCFLYLGCFGEDQEIDTERLYLLWIADGLIPYEEKGRNEILRDVAERYLNELASRCMVQVQKHVFSSAYNKFKSCRLHDLMRDLCVSKGEDKDFLKLIDLCGQKNCAPSVGTASRLAIHYDEYPDDYVSRREGVLKNLRSLLLLRKGPIGSMPKIGSNGCGTDFNKLKRLRTIALENGKFVLPNELGNVIHLRYLSLFGSSVEELPLSITNLTYLQSLDLRMGWDDIKVPNVIRKMKRLKHLFLKEIKVIGEHGDKLILDGLDELETLRDESSSASRVRLADIRKLTNLRHLETTVSGDVEFSIIADHMSCENIQLREAHLRILDCDFSSMEDVENLRKMLMSPSLTNFKIWNGDIDFSFPRYEQGMCRNLLHFTLGDSATIERDDIMEILGQFPMLERLMLDRRVFLNGEMRCLPTSFPHLKFLSLENLQNLERWVVDKGAMPNLSSLCLDHCGGLQMIPDGLQFITTLQELTTQGMPGEFNDRLRQVVNGQPGEDYHKVRHIPSISFMDQQW